MTDDDLPAHEQSEPSAIDFETPVATETPVGTLVELKEPIAREVEPLNIVLSLTDEFLQCSSPGARSNLRSEMTLEFRRIINHAHTAALVRSRGIETVQITADDVTVASAKIRGELYLAHERKERLKETVTELALALFGISVGIIVSVFSPDKFHTDRQALGMSAVLALIAFILMLLMRA